jgi:hypothetical protein
MKGGRRERKEVKGEGEEEKERKDGRWCFKKILFIKAGCGHMLSRSGPGASGELKK